MNIKAYAKINLCLNVVGKRDDGYHELEMIMVPLTLHDTITITLSNKDEFTCSDATLPMDEHNTVVKAVSLLRSLYPIQEHFHIHVEKNIPAQAGLAGGSADGAAVLRGIRDLLKLPITLEELSLKSKQIGADVPFCVMQTSALVKGIGEKITPIHIHSDFEILLVKPNEGVSTKKAFAMLDFNACEHPDCNLVKDCLEQDRFQDLASSVSNSLEYSAFQLVPQIKALKQTLLHKGFDVVLMSGSGSSVFALTRDLTLIKETEIEMKNKGYFVSHTHMI
ncbi:MAG: 4-(cytidine 5'-diphospho)-2-C-methyl-D-erythritol kinase [Longicatena sp.]